MKEYKVVHISTRKSISVEAENVRQENNLHVFVTKNEGIVACFPALEFFFTVVKRGVNTGSWVSVSADDLPPTVLATPTEVKPDNVGAGGELLGEFLTRDELADQLKMSTRKLDRMEAMRIGPPRTVFGRTILFRRDSVMEWLRNSETAKPKRSR